jgi:peptide/nickel transport system permease protein
MISYIIRRVTLSIVILMGVSVLTFLLTRVVPSDPAMRWVGKHASPEQVAAARVELGLDRPLYVQYGKYIFDFFRGDWGVSIRTRRPVLKDILEYLPASLELIFAGMIPALLLGIPLGTLAAAKAGSSLDHVTRFFVVLGVGMPVFWLGMILQLVFFNVLHILPLAERLDTLVKLLHPIRTITGFHLVDSLLTGNFTAFADALKHIVLPAVAMGAFPLGMTVRMTRATMLGVLNEDYLRTARAVGHRESRVLIRYGLRNAVGPVLVVAALTLAYALVETFLIESIFAWPGLGYYASKGISTMDYPVIMGITFLVAIVFVSVK